MVDGVSDGANRDWIWRPASAPPVKTTLSTPASTARADAAAGSSGSNCTSAGSKPARANVCKRR